MYAIVDDAPRNDVYKSTDRGESWQRLRVPNLPYSPPYILAAHPLNPKYFWVSADDPNGILYLVDLIQMSAYIYADGLPSKPERPSSIVTHPDDPDTAYLGFPYHGIFANREWPPKWNLAVQGLNNTYINDLAIDPAEPQKVYAAVKGSVGSIGHPLAVSDSGGAAWNYLENSPGSLQTVAIDPQVPSTLYVGQSQYSGSLFYIYRSLDNGQNWTAIRYLYVTPGSITLGVGDIWIDPRDSDTILVAGAGFGGINNGGGTYKTIDGGLSWARTSSFWAETLAADPNDPSVLYYGSQHCGYVFRSTNTGSSWINISPSAPAGQCWINEVRALEIDADGRVYAATDDGLWKRDSGIWAKLSGLATEDISALTIDRSTKPETIYAGTGDYGVLFSQNGGNTWIPYNIGLGNLSLTALEISDNDPKILYAGTAHGGVWQHDFDTEPCEGDFNEDQKVDHLDLASFSEEFGNSHCNGDCDRDCDGDQDADGKDLATIVADYGRTDCPVLHE
jgi:hypothetical protein